MFDLTLSIAALPEIWHALLPTAVQGTQRHLTNHLRDCLCDYQIQYTNYAFRCAQEHRDFKQAVRDEDNARADECYQRLNSAVEDGLNLICAGHAKMVRKYFEITRRTKTPPKVGIHLMNDRGELVTAALESHTNLSSDHDRIPDDTILEHMIDTGLPYLDNSLPATAISSPNYHHSSLDLDRVRKFYRQRWTDRNWLSRWRMNLLQLRPFDSDWDACWNDLKKGESSYKSQLGIPITFRAHAARHRLSRKMVEVLCLPEEGRAIIGFLIVDHPSTFYFDEHPGDSYDNLDVNVMYLFADTLSMALVTARTYTSGSVTVRNYLQSNLGNQQ